MKLEKAIKDLEQSKRWYESHNATEQAEAHQLGIEAMKRLKEARGWPNHVLKELLPGETKE